MSIEKMEYVTIVGLEKYVDRALAKCVESGVFHISDAMKSPSTEASFIRLGGENPYKELLKRVVSIETGKDFTFEKADFEKVSVMTETEIDDLISDMKQQFHEVNGYINDTEEKIRQRQQVLKQLTHLHGMKFDFKRIFECSHIQVQFGRLPCESALKLSYYSDKTFIFVPYDDDGVYQWGFYFAPADHMEEAKRIFKTLYFEKVRIPDFVKDTPEVEEKRLNDELKQLEKDLEAAKAEYDELVAENRELLNQIFSYLKFSHDVYELRTNVAAYKSKFYMTGFVPKSKIKEFKECFSAIPEISIVNKNASESTEDTPPVKLKNNRFARPFSMFVEMYGLPSYNGFNPTMLVAITYTILFGIMFGDLGQGLVISLIGWFVYRKSGNMLGAILQRVGISSAVFGLLYGSVFGFEEALDPLYHKIGLSGKPIHIMDNTMGVLLAAIVIGVAIIFISIIINIFISFKHKDYVNAVFGNNGIAGFIVFGAILAGIGGMMTGIADLFTMPYIIGLIVVPVIVMFFREPLGCLCKGEKFHMEGGIGDFIASNFFEVFEFMLGYATNTLSFVRIGGFVFSHAGMMSVVMLLSETASKGVSPVIIVLGNIFVMGMEGLIVGIQVLRLEFYEVFSRFYDGDGHAFEPVTIKYDTNIE